VREHTSGSASPACTPDALALTISKIIEDMEGASEAGESTTQFPDRRILAKLCLLREEARMVAAEARMLVSNDGATSNTDASKSEWEAGDTASSTAITADISSYTLLQTVPQREVAFLKEILAVGSSERRCALLEAAFRGDIQVNKPALLRTGAFMDSLKAIQTEILGPQYGSSQGGVVPMETAARLESVWRDALAALGKIADEREYSS